MSAQTEPQIPSTPAYSSRVSDFLASRRGKMFGLAEVAALVVSCFVFVLVLLSYLYFLVPARSRIASLNTDRKQLQANLQTLDGVVNSNTDRMLARSIASSFGAFSVTNDLKTDAEVEQELEHL